MNNLTSKTQKSIVIFTFLFIPVLLLGTFTYYPALNLIYLSFTSWDGVSRVKEFVGMENYTWIFSKPSLYTPFLHNLVYFFMGLLQILAALYFAVILNSKLKWRNLFRTVLFMPYVINSVAVAFMFNFFFNNEFGAFNILLRDLGLDKLALNWLGEPKIVNYTMALMGNWKYMGFMMVIFIGVLNSIPAEFYEAAQIDGAKPFQAFRYITYPGIISIVKLNLFLNLNGALSAFEFPFIIYPLGSVFDMSETFMTKTIHTAFDSSSFGLASAMGVISMLVVSTLVLLQNKIVSEGD